MRKIERVGALTQPAASPSGNGRDIYLPGIQVYLENTITADKSDPALTDSSTRVMQSFGAGMVEIRGGGSKYNLKPGVSAELTIPVDQSQLSARGPLPAPDPAALL